MTQFNQSKYSQIRDYAVIAFGMLIFSVAATAFLIPHRIVGGGATGIGTIVYFLSGETIPVGVSYCIFNVVLLIIAIKVLGPKFGIKTIFAIVVGSVFLTIMQHFIKEAWVEDKFMSTIIAGILTGTGIGMAISHGGSTGGTDIIVMLITKYHNVSPGKVLMYIDACIIACTLIINPFNELIYGYVMMGVVGYTLDYVLTGKSQSAQLFIFSNDYEKVAEAINNNVHRGITIIDGHGWYTKSEKKVIMVVARKTEAMDILKIAKMADPEVFMTMGQVMGVFGKGFDEVKGVKTTSE